MFIRQNALSNRGEDRDDIFPSSAICVDLDNNKERVKRTHIVGLISTPTCFVLEERRVGIVICGGVESRLGMDHVRKVGAPQQTATHMTTYNISFKQIAGQDQRKWSAER